MKVEIISENKVEIRLTIDELYQRNLSLNDIEKDAKKARQLFADLIEETNLASDFHLDHTQVFVEATTDSNNEFIVTITKIDDFPDISKFDILTTQNINKSSYIDYYSNFSIFKFKTLDSIINMSKVLVKSKCYIGKNSLYKYNDDLFLIFTNYVIKQPKFLKTVSLINEFSDDMYESGIFEVSLKEKAKLMIKDKAIQKLSKI